MVLATDWGVGEVLWTFIYFTFLFIWIWLAISVFIDIFRSHDMGGWAKALWCLFIIFMPYLGVFVYLIARGKKMSEHAMQEAQAQDQAARAYIQNVTASSTSASDELAKLADLRSRGVIDDTEFAAMKAKVIGA
jgi:hypothetical protein